MVSWKAGLNLKFHISWLVSCDLEWGLFVSNFLVMHKTSFFVSGHVQDIFCFSSLLLMFLLIFFLVCKFYLCVNIYCFSWHYFCCFHFSTSSFRNICFLFHDTIFSCVSTVLCCAVLAHLWYIMKLGCKVRFHLGDVSVFFNLYC